MCLTCGCMDAHREMGEANITYEDIKRAADENGTERRGDAPDLRGHRGQGPKRARQEYGTPVGRRPRDVDSGEERRRGQDVAIEPLDRARR